MYSIEAKDLSHKDKYLLMSSGITPRPIAFVSTISQSGIYNLAPFSFFNAFSCEPPIIVFCPARREDSARPYKDTYLNLIETQDCVVQMVNFAIKEKMLKTAQDLAPEIDEFEIAGLTPIASDLVKAPRVKESPFQMECKLIEMKELGTNPGAGNMAICEVVKFHVDENIFDAKNKIDPRKIDLIGRNGGFYYTRVNFDAIFEMN